MGKHACEFCGTEYQRYHHCSRMRRITGNDGSCPECGKHPTPPDPKPENLRPATDLFPHGLSIHKAGDGLFHQEQLSIEPYKMPGIAYGKEEEDEST